MQKVMICHTLRNGMRDKIEGWSLEDGDQVYKSYKERVHTLNEFDSMFSVPVGLIRSGNGHCYSTVLHAIGDGWKLLAPPQEYTEKMAGGPTVQMWEWWLVKD